MATAQKQLPATKVITGKVRASYVHLFAPWKGKDAPEAQEEKYSVSIIVPKTNKALIAQIEAATDAAAAANPGKFKGGKVPAKFKRPLRDGDDERGDDPAYQGCMFLNANSSNKPQVVEMNANGNLVEVTDERHVYSGCYIRASLNFYAFSQQGGGVAAGLNNVQFISDGDALDGRTSATVDFNDNFVDPDAEDVSDNDIAGL